MGKPFNLPFSLPRPSPMTFTSLSRLSCPSFFFSRRFKPSKTHLSRYVSLLFPRQAPAAEKTAVQLEEEARSFALRLKHVSKFAWSQYLRAVNSGTSHLVGAARKNVTEPTDGTLPLRTAGAAGAAAAAVAGAKSASSPTVSPRALAASMEPPYKTALLRGGGGIADGGAASLANPLQATFLNRAHLVEVDDEHAAKCKLRWESTRAWTWGYQTQCRWNKTAEAEERSPEELEGGGVVVETKALPMGRGTPSTAAMVVGSVHRGATGIAIAAGVLPISAGGATLAQRGGGGEGLGARGGREEPTAGKRGFTPSNSRLLRMSPPIVSRAADSARSVSAEGGGSSNPSQTPESVVVRGGQQGFTRTKIASPAPLPPSRDSDATQELPGVPGMETKNQRSFAPFSTGACTRATAAAARAAGASAVAAAAVAAVVDGPQAPAERALLDREESTLQRPNGLQNVMSQCRLHRMAVYPLLLPMPPAPSTPKESSAKGSPRGDDDIGGDAGVVETEFRSPACINQLTAAWGGDSIEEEGRWRSGKWGALIPLDGRKPGPGAAGNSGVMDAIASPKEWMSSSHNSPAVAFSTGGIAAGASGGGFTSKDKHQSQSSDFDIADHVRSRSATSSGTGNYSFDSTLDPEERSNRKGAPIARLLAPGEIPPPPPPPPPPLHARSSRGSAREGEVDSSEVGREPRQTRSASLAVFAGDWTRVTEIGMGSAARRKTSAVEHSLIDAPTASTPTGMQTAEDSRNEAASGVVETEVERAAARAVALARQFVDAYSTFLVDSLGFTPVGCGKGAGGVANGGDQKARLASAGIETEVATPDPSKNFDGMGWGTSPSAPGGGSGGGGGDDDSSTANHCGNGGEILARGCLRLALELTNTIVLVDVSVSIVHDEAAAGAAAAAAERTQRLWSSEVPGAAAGVQRRQHHISIVADTMLASVKMWTVDVVEPGDGWKGDGPVGTSAGGGSPSWWANQPTLSSFAWNLNPNEPLLRGDCLPDELPRELHRVIDGLQFRNSVEDFSLGQVSRSLRETCLRQVFHLLRR